MKGKCKTNSNIVLYSLTRSERITVYIFPVYFIFCKYYNGIVGNKFHRILRTNV